MSTCSAGSYQNKEGDASIDKIGRARGGMDEMEEETFDAAGKATSTDDDGIEILQVYSKEISKRMLKTVKARSTELVAPPPQANEASVNAEDEDVGSTAPSRCEKTESVADDE